MLDESAIEAMIARQREVMNRRHEPAPSVRTVQTDEFEVYERPTDPAPAPAAPATPQAPPAPPTPEPEEFEVFERQSPQPEPVRNPLPPQPVPHPEPTPGPTPTPGPEPTPQAPQPSTEQTRPFAPQPTRRPEVWPPLGTRDASLAPAAPTPAPTPSAPTHPAVAATPPEPDVTPRSHAPAAPATPDAPPPSTPARSDASATTGHAFPDLSGTTTGTGGDTPRLAIVQALFNEEITGDMLGLARQKAEKLGAPVVHHVTVPGVYDLPLAVQTLLHRDDVDACVVLGCVVTGETRHDEVITHATAKSLQEVSLATGKPVGFGVIGPGMTWKQAEARVSSGKHAVEAAVAQWRVLRGLTA